MGGGGQPKNTTTTTKTELPPWLASAYQQFFNQTNQVNSKPYQSYDGQLNAPMSQGQGDALWTAQQGVSGQGLGQADQLAGLQSLVQGGNNVYAQSNPYAGQNDYLNNVIANSNADTVDAYNRSVAPQLASQFSQGGAFGGSAMSQAVQDSQRTLADRLAQNSTNLRYQDYQNQANLWQQGFQNQLAASQNNAQNILGAAQGLNGYNALRSQWNSQLAGLGQVQQDYAQGNIDQAYNDWYQKNYGYDQQRLANYGNALNSVAGQFQGSATSGLNPAYKPRTAAGGVASAAGGAAAGASLGSAIAGGASAGSAGGWWGAGIGALAGAASYYL